MDPEVQRLGSGRWAITRIYKPIREVTLVFACLEC